MINLKPIVTSGNNALCGYYSMANYIKTLPFNSRKDFYIKLFQQLNSDNRYNFNDEMFKLFEDLIKENDFSEEKFNSLKKKYQEKTVNISFDDFQNFFHTYSQSSKIDFEHVIGDLLHKFGKQIIDESKKQLLKGSEEETNELIQSKAIDEATAESFITAENLKKTFKFFFSNQDMAMSQEIENIYLKPQITNSERQTITTESPTHSNPRLESIKKIVDSKCKILVTVKSNSLDDFNKKTHNEKKEILFYLLFKNILNHLQVEDKIFNCPLTYDRYSKYFEFSCNDNGAIVKNVLRELIDFSKLGEVDESSLMARILKSNNFFSLSVQKLAPDILKNLKEQFSLFSFRFRFLSSNPFCVSNDNSVHYTTMIDSKRSQDLLSKSSFKYDLSFSKQSEAQDGISQMMIDDFFKKANQCYDKLLSPKENAGVNQDASKELIKIYRSTEIFPRHNGRNNDIIRCEKNVKEAEKCISDILGELKEKHKMSDEDLVLAVAIAKTFGGIGSALGQIQKKFDEIDTQVQNQTVQNQVENNFFQLCRSIFTTINRKKFCQFSAEFQKICQQKGIYSGRQELTDQQAKNYGCRLTFVPDEVFTFHFNALPYSSKTRQTIDQYIASHQRHKAVEVVSGKKLTNEPTQGPLIT